MFFLNVQSSSQQRNVNEFVDEIKVFRLHSSSYWHFNSLLNLIKYLKYNQEPKIHQVFTKEQTFGKRIINSFLFGSYKCLFHKAIFQI